MRAFENNIQVFYEIALSIGNSLNIKKMLQESLNVYLKNFKFAAGAVLQAGWEGKAVYLEPVLTIPRKIEENEAFQKALSNIPETIPEDQIEGFLRRLPMTGQHGHMFYHIMELKNFGLLVFLKSHAPLDDDLLKSLLPLNNKLANACRACLRNDALQKMAADLKKENVDRQKAEAALSESHERLMMILNSIEVLIYVADMKTHEMIFINHPMKNLFGDNSGQRLCYEIFRAEGSPCPDCSNASLMDANGKPIGVVVWEDRNPVTRRWYVHHARAIKWIDGRWVRLQISTDITDLKQLEQDRIRDTHLQQSQRLEALGILAGGIAHEFNNLLMAMLGNLSLIKFKLDDRHPTSRHLDKIEESIRAAANLTDRLLGYAQKGRYENTKLQLNTLIRSSVSAFMKSHESIRIHMSLSKALHPIEADQRQIEHVLSNLLSNAADAMPGGGELFIQTVNVNRGGLRGKPYKLPVENYVEMRVRDTGKGMSAEIRKRIFDPFYTTKPMVVGKGAGLGLAATYGIIKAHSGFIDVISHPNRGSEFIIYLPAVIGPGERVWTSKTEPSVPRTILLIDDEKLALEIGTQILEHLGYQVIQAGSGMEAIAQYKSYHDRIDAVILDIVMPEMTGIETFERIKAEFPEARILLASGYILDAEARRLLEHGADGFVKKPFAIEELYNSIEKTVAK